MIDRMSAHGGSHSGSLEMLGLHRNHPIILSNEAPRRLVLPQRPGGLLLDALHVDRPLCGEEPRLDVGGRILRERMFKTFGRHPDKSAAVRGQFRGLDMGW